MAYTDSRQNIEFGLLQRVRAAWDAASKHAAQRNMYHKTLNELNALSQRELDDMGIYRASIPEIAHAAAYGD